MSQFRGEFSGQKTYLNGTKASSGKTSVSCELDLFTIEEPASQVNYTSDQSGVLGLGPDSEFNEPNINLVTRLNQLHQTKEIVLYNITFTGEHNREVDHGKSYVQIGDYNQALKPNFTMNVAEHNRKYSNMVDRAMISTVNPSGNFPIEEYNGTLAIFDPAVDYLHMNEISFTPFVNVLKGIYDTNITCNEEFCHFNVTCDLVTKHNATIDIALGKSLMDDRNIELNLEDYMYNDLNPMTGKGNVCIYPVFRMDAGVDADAFMTLFMGNMFLNRYMVLHHNEFLLGQTLAYVGIYDKVDPTKNPSALQQEANFL